MATNPEKPSSDDHHFDELSGVYGFFRRHQKVLLYTAGLFALLTFSITGPVLNLVNELFGTRQPMPSILVRGERVKLTTEDYSYGNLLVRHYLYGVPAGVMLPVSSGEGGDGELGEVFAILRRAAIAEGIDVSLAEVDRAIEAAREQANAESAAKLARARGFSSLAQYRALVAEALRIGTYTRLQLLALDSSDAAVMRQALQDREKITLEVATFDEKQRQEEMIAASELTDDQLRAWLDEKADREKQRMAVYDLPRVKLRFVALRLDPDTGFDPSEWQDGVLQDFTITDDQLQSYFEQEKDLRFKTEDGEYEEFDDESVRTRLTRLVQAERVMNDLLGKVRQQQLDALKPLTDELTRVQGELQAKQREEAEARQELLTNEKELESKRAALTAAPDDEALKAEVAELERAVGQAKDAVFAAEAVVPAMQQAVEAAETAQREARAAFDLYAALAPMIEGKRGFVQKERAELRDADALQDLDELGLKLGEWPQAASGTSLQNPGDLGFGPGRTGAAVVVYQAVETQPKPLKAWDELKPLLEEAYFAEKAREEGVEKRKALKEELLRRAKELIPEFVAEREGDRQNRIDTAMNEWREGVQAAIADAEQKLATPNLGTQARTAWQRKLEQKQQELANEQAQLERTERVVGQKLDKEIEDEAKKHFGDVLAAAAAEVGFTMREIGPYPRDLQQRPRFDDAYDDTVVYLWRNFSELEEGEATDVLNDVTARRSHVAVCRSVEPLTPADVTRREFEILRRGFGGSFARLQMFQAIQHAFTKEALVARYEFEQPVGRLTEPTPQ